MTTETFPLGRHLAGVLVAALLVTGVLLPFVYGTNRWGVTLGIAAGVNLALAAGILAAWKLVLGGSQAKQNQVLLGGMTVRLLVTIGLVLLQVKGLGLPTIPVVSSVVAYYLVLTGYETVVMYRVLTRKDVESK